MAEIPEGTVTVLFTDLVESTRLNQELGDDAAHEVARAAETMTRDLVAQEGGIPVKGLGDGLMAAFNSARRAVKCAQSIQSRLRDVPGTGRTALLMRIGLHTGEVIAEDGDIHGETVIIAKRIESEASAGGILASESVYAVLGTDRRDLVDRGQVQLKGIEMPWRLYEVPVPADEASAGLADDEPTPYVGRLGEMRELRTLVEGAAEGAGGMVILSGPAGLGKSRLCSEALATATQLGVTCRVGHCVDMDAPPPYLPVFEQLEQAMRETTPEGFRRGLGVNAAELALLMPSLRGRYDDIPPVPELSTEQERHYMMSGVVEFVERAARQQPLALVFEDLHWADESTLLLLRHIAPLARSCGLAVIGTYRIDDVDRSDAVSRLLPTLVRDYGAIELQLRPLTRDDVAAVLHARSGKEPPNALASLIFDETQGNPFFVEEVYRHLRASGRLFHPSTGDWLETFDMAETEVPPTVLQVISRRLDQLSDESRRILARSAVIGRSFRFDVLMGIGGAPQDTVFDALEAGERMHLIADASVDAIARYAFTHEQIRQALLAEISLPRRQRLHAAVADVLDGSGGASEIASHLMQAGPAVAAESLLGALLDAAKAAIAALAFEDALRHLDAAYAAGTDIEPLRRLSLRAAALRGAGKVDEALTTITQALDGPISAGERLDLLRMRVGYLLEQYRGTETLVDIDELVEAARTAGDYDREIDALLERGRAHYVLALDDPAHAEQSLEAYEAAHQRAAEHDDRTNMVRALLATTWFTDYWTDYRDTAAHNVDEAVRLAESLGDGDLILDARSAALRQRGAIVEIEAGEELLAQLEERRDPVRLNAHCFWLMWQYLIGARLADCVTMCDGGIELAARIGSAPVQYGSIKAIALSDQARFDEVEAAIAQEITDDDHVFGQAMASLARSAFLTRIAAWEPAYESIQDTLTRATDLSRVWMQAWANELLAKAAIGLGVSLDHGNGPIAADFLGDRSTATLAETALGVDPQEARRLIQPILDRSVEHRSHEYVEGLFLAARASLLLGRHGSLADEAARGIAVAGDTGFGSLTWQFRMLHARALRALGDHAKANAAERVAGHEFAALRDRIADPELAGWFERQSLAPGQPFR